MTLPRLLLFDPLALFAAARQGGAAQAGATRAWLVGLGRAGAVERHALWAGESGAARAWFAHPGSGGDAGQPDLLACVDRVYATGGGGHAGAWQALLRHALAQARVAPAQALLLGAAPALLAARAMSLPAVGVDDPVAAMAWTDARLRQRYGASPGAFGTAWGRLATPRHGVAAGAGRADRAAAAMA